MADIADLPWFLCKGDYRGVVPDTLDVGIRPDQYRPWAEATLTPQLVDTGNRLITAPAGVPELRLTGLNPPLTVLLTPTTARIETGTLRLPRLNAPAGETTPPTQGQIDAQQTTEGVPLITNDAADTLALGTRRIAWRVDFAPMTILAREYRYTGFWFLGPIVSSYNPADANWSPPVVNLTTVTRFEPTP
ncbi:hypothetical protein LV457_03015 [Mycobacterium sp. MYCO198283]|uniref:hypothetical protein n=1 Tax=Mycobacterium sp. MYCO198283 TaxID=2883505 RepID=UPI001E423154|nr:hypothetical protein [Mycobacterium sp. MYCO198283]MCG5431260.1 hypothetical protein [Mycobacterium sp. MYCO198283]